MTTIKPSDIDLTSLPWLPLEEKAAFPKRPAIYFAIDSFGTVQYIGKSVNVRHRWGSHHRYEKLKNIGNIRIAYLFVDLPELLPEIEQALIKHFHPQLNTVRFTETKLIRTERKYIGAGLHLKEKYLQDNKTRIDCNTPSFEQWLQDNISFRVEAGENSYRARKESYTSNDYWYAVKKVDGKLHKKFIGKSDEVTCDRLKEVADVIRQPPVKTPPKAVVQPVDQISLAQKITALEAQVTAMQEQLTKLVEYQGKVLA
ncbi:GIY-YIG nuclease family protein [Brasilonema bromeliae]|uniref:GIY-YIG domain-containing protein n=1 Tax=Brasilonema bromeliae SPC951 TaxID=385972 RepID=A0ABX1P8F8_9CYAN|nr:GIY-YIG nuclease family protein [Brasilonema bromeliae]NMG20700.1 hypothetical protein [Brasilonema bromeliae SPC951]